jgi:hypothetical protein
MRQWRILGMIVLAGALGACTHVRGIVVDEGTGRPRPSAVFTVGRPDGIAIYQRNPVDKNGRFDFYISPTDESSLYVYDSSWGAASTMRRIDRTEITEQMRVEMPRVSSEPDGGFGPMQ